MELGNIIFLMKMDSIGVLIGLYPLNERDAIARVFTRDFGILVGMMRGALVAKKNRPLVGQVGNVSWNARLDSQLGVFHWDAEKNLSATIMMDSKKLSCMNAAFDLLITLLPECEAYQHLYDETILMLQDLSNNESDVYLCWEISLLRELGYALDFSRCSGCGKTTDLNYLSPRTGRAVCDTCAVPYIDRLYKLPVDLNITGCFLDAVCAQQGVQIPIMRKMLKVM